jgi:hypothetical protein
MARVRSKATNAATTTPWWLTEGEEECPHCGQLYFLELELRCSACDGPSCPHCKVRLAEGRIVCPECADGADG